VLLSLPLSLFNPGKSILVAHGLPYAPDYARDVAVVRFDARRDLLLRDEIASEKDEGVPWSRNVSLGLLSGVRLLYLKLWRGLNVVRGRRTQKCARS
jgi:hypothetical protein